MEKICLLSASRPSVTWKCEEELLWLFFLVLSKVGFALDVFFFFFSDTLTLRERKVLIEKELSGVRLRCQIGVIWFWLTPKVGESGIFRNFLTPLIINELSGFGVRWCQIQLSQSDTDEVAESQLHSLNGVRSVRLFREKSIVKK